MKLQDLQKDTVLTLVCEGNHRAFDAFYHLYYQKVFHIAYYYVKDVATCREIVSNVFFSIWKSRQTLSDVYNLDAYLYKVTKNQALHFLSQQSATQMLSLSETVIPLEITDTISTDDHLISEELEQCLSKIVNKLPDKCRTIFLMSRTEALDNKEIAQLLDISESTVRVQLKIAIGKIMAQLKALYPNLSLPVFLFLILH